MFRGNYLQWLSYRAPDFHPRQQDAALFEQWLRNNTDQFTAVGQFG